MTLYEELSPKQRRIIKKNIELILSLKGLFLPKTIDEIKDVFFTLPRIKYENRELYLTDDGKNALRRICDFIYQSKMYENLLNYNDIFQGVRGEVERWLNDMLIPDDEEFLNPLEIILSNKIREFYFICMVDGLSLDEIDNISVGDRKIVKFSSTLIPTELDADNDTIEWVKKTFNNSLVIVGSERGSNAVAEEKFFHNSELSLSVLRLYSCALYKHASQRINIRLLQRYAYSYMPANLFGWTIPEKKHLFARFFHSPQNFKIDDKLYKYLKSYCFFKEILNFIDKEQRTEVEDAIVRSLFWIGEAHKAQSYASAWVNFWSCIECFFSLGDDDITEKNARGISAMLIFGGHSHKNFDDYKKLKNKIKYYYKLRSKIVHRAKYTHIDAVLLGEFSYIVAWVIITMTSLSVKGYATLFQVQKQIERLDSMKVVLTKSSPKG
jgi:hypothetical protein